MNEKGSYGLIGVFSHFISSNIIMEATRDAASSVGSLLDGLHAKLTQEITAGNLLLPSRPRPFRGLSPASPSAPLFKSQFSAVDQKEVQKLKAEMVQFQEGLAARSRAVEQEERRLREEAARDKQRRIRAQSEKHREAALVRKQQRWLQKREQQLLAGNASRHSPSTRLLYRQAEQKQAKQEQLQQKERAQLLSVLSQQRRGLVNISRLNQHEQSYIRRVRQQKAQRMRRMEEARATAKTLQEAEASVTLRSRFYQRVLTEQQQRHEAAEQAKRQKQRSRQKLREFMQRIRSQSQLATQAHPSHRATTQPDHLSHVRHQLSPVQLKEAGDRFLKESLLHVAKNPKRSIASELPPSPQRTDYLQQLRRQRTTTGSQRSFLLQEGKIQRILISPLPREEKVEKLKRMAHRLQAGPPSADAQQEVQKIHAKMKILQAALRARE